MSKASEKKAMSESLASYSLMSVPQLAAFLRCSEPIATEMLDSGVIPSVPVGKRRKVDPIHAVAHLLAGEEGFDSARPWWDKHGEACIELIRVRYHRIRKVQAA